MCVYFKYLFLFKQLILAAVIGEIMNKVTLLSIPLVLASLNATAGFTVKDNYFNEAFDVFSQPGWNEFAYSGSAVTNYAGVARSDGIVGPGGGGQKFDAEFLFYKFNEATNEISIGLQSGFDIIDGHYKSSYSGKDYYAGDLALSFNGVSGGQYEYALDFGNLTKTYTNGSNTYYNPQSLGTDAAGLYENVSWNNDIYYNASSPFAMETGTNTGVAVDLSVKGQGNVDEIINIGNTNYSYYRVATFSLDSIVDTSQNFTIDAHWTMSCGNDDINGNAQLAGVPNNPVPEPSVLALMGIGSMSIILSGLRRRKLI